jgi:hypothetical protein
MHASEKGHSKCVQLLLAHSTDAQVIAADKQGSTAPILKHDCPLLAEHSVFLMRSPQLYCPLPKAPSFFSFGQNKSLN